MISYDEWYETAKPYLIHHCHHHLDSLQFLDLWPSWAPGTACVYVQTNMHQLYYKLTMALVLFPFKLIHSPNNYYELLSCFPSFYDSRYSAKGTCLHHSFVSLQTAQPSKTHRLFIHTLCEVVFLNSEHGHFWSVGLRVIPLLHTFAPSHLYMCYSIPWFWILRK